MRSERETSHECFERQPAIHRPAELLTGMVSEFKDRFIPIAADATSEDDVVRAFREAQQCDRLKSAFDVVGGARVAPLVGHSLEDWMFPTALIRRSRACARKHGS